MSWTIVLPGGSTNVYMDKKEYLKALAELPVVSEQPQPGSFAPDLVVPQPAQPASPALQPKADATDEWEAWL